MIFCERTANEAIGSSPHRLLRIGGLLHTRAMTSLEHRLRQILTADFGRMAALRSVRAMHLPQGAIGAGYIRAAVWDALTGQRATPVEDVDVIYFDPADVSKDTEDRIESGLRSLHPGPAWSVRNQARMAARKGDRPYASLADALTFWLETPTCVAVRLTDADRLEIVAPFGLDDLFAMRICPTPRGRERAADYRTRIETKRWQDRWPRVSVEMPQPPRR